ncbi:hypothetical protein HDV03_002088 [Kappamyces sp. JEL0829]|nr:hypothetical protein HDV03_002088 [Kappamyces sp. JEL0829]
MTQDTKSEPMMQVDPPGPALHPLEVPKEDPANPVSAGIDSYLLPASVVQRVAKQVLPPGAAIGYGPSAQPVFINYLTATALAHADKKTKTIGRSPGLTAGLEQVYRALSMMELDQSLLGPVRDAVSVHISSQKEKRDAYRKKVKDQKLALGLDVGDADHYAEGDEEEDLQDIPKGLEATPEAVSVPSKRPAEHELPMDQDMQ